MSDRAQRILVLACMAGALFFVGSQVFRAKNTRSYAPDSTFSERARLTEFVTNGVRVVVFMEADGQGNPLLRATFTPTDAGFHVYGKDHDPQTADGVGTATRLELLRHSSVIVAGQLFADLAAESHWVKELNTNMDIYPEGPVSLRLPIQFVGAATNIAAQVAVSYMACKTDGVCLQPVERQILNVQFVSRSR